MVYSYNLLQRGGSPNVQVAVTRGMGVSGLFTPTVTSQK